MTDSTKDDEMTFDEKVKAAHDAMDGMSLEELDIALCAVIRAVMIGAPSLGDAVTLIRERTEEHANVALEYQALVDAAPATPTVN